jgi:hypothetical protein
MGEDEFYEWTMSKHRSWYCRNIARKLQLRNLKLRPQMLPGMFSDPAKIVVDSVDAIGKSIKAVGDIPAGLETIGALITQLMASESTRKALDDFGDASAALKKISEEGIKGNVNHRIPLLDDLMDKILENKKTVGVIVCALFLVYLVYTRKNKKMLYFVLLLIGFYIFKYHGPDVKRIFLETVSNFGGTFVEVTKPSDLEEIFGDGYRPQSIQVESILTGCFKIMCLCGLSDFAPTAVVDYFDAFWSTAQRFPHRLNDVNKTFDFYVGLMQDMLNGFCKLLDIDHKFAFKADLYPEATALVQDCERFIQETESNEHLLVSNAAQTCEAFKTKIQQMLLENKDPRFSSTANLLRDTRSRLRTLTSSLELRGAGKTATRVPPIAWMFSGQPKLGKSYFLTMLITAALGRLYKDVPEARRQMLAGQERDFWFSANLNSKHWEGYHGQLVVQVDDVGVQRDCSGMDPEVSELHKLIRMVNDAAYPLTMANLELKGKVEFDSAVLLCTTNKKEWNNMLSIENTAASAFCRRFTGWDVSVKEKYSVPYFDGVDAWNVVMPIDDLREVLREEGRNEDEIEEFITTSAFLEFRKRKTIRMVSAGFDDEKVYSSMELVEELCKAIDNRNSTKVVKANHRKKLLDMFIDNPDTTMRPQGKSECMCNVCQENYSLQLTDSYFHSLAFGKSNSDYNPLPFMVRGWNVAKNLRPAISDLSEVPCFVRILLESEGKYIETFTKYGEWLRSAHDFVSGGLSKFRRLCASKTLQTISSVVGVCTVAYGAYKLVNTLFGSDGPKVPEDLNEEDRFPNGVLAWKIEDMKWKRIEDGDEIACVDLNAQNRDLNAKEVLVSTLNRNVYSFSDTVPNRGYVTMVANCVMAVPQHYLLGWQKMDPDQEIYLQRANKCSSQKFYLDMRTLCKESNHFYPLGKSADLVFILLDDRTMPIQPSLEEKTYRRVGDNRPSGRVLLPVLDGTHPEVVSAPYASHAGSYIDGGVELQAKGISYLYPTRDGFCGLPVVVEDTNTPSGKKIYGIHTAGNGRTGMSVPITGEMIERSLDHYASLKKNRVVMRAQINKSERLNKFEEIGDLTECGLEDLVEEKLTLGKVPKPSNPFTTVIRKSPLYRKIGGAEPKTRPASLRPFVKEGDVIDPARDGMLKYSVTVPLWDLRKLDMCVSTYNSSVFNHPIYSVDERVGRSELSYETAVCGMPGVDGLDGIKRKTSAGYPYCMLVTRGGKKDFFGEDGDYEFGGEMELKLRQEVQDMITSAKSGKRGLNLCRVTLKDERRKPGKGARLIMGSSVRHLIACRMLSGAFLQNLQLNRFLNGMAIGANVYKEADEIVRWLGEDSKYIAGDFSNFDGRLPYFLLARFADTQDAFYRDWGSDASVARMVLLEDVANSRHVDGEGRVVEWHGSNSSGNAYTSYINSWCNLMGLRMATLQILGLAGASARKFLMEIDSHVRFLVYGDDNIIAVQRGSPHFGVLTQQAYSEAFDSLGWVYTDEEKRRDVFVEGRTLGDISFLKRTFEKTHPDPSRRYMLALSLDTILEMPQWKKKRDFYDEDVKLNVCNALIELSAHPRGVFDDWSRKIIDASINYLEFTPFPLSYEECQQAFLERGSPLY